MTSQNDQGAKATDYAKLAQSGEGAQALTKPLGERGGGERGGRCADKKHVLGRIPGRCAINHLNAKQWSAMEVSRKYPSRVQILENEQGRG